MFVPNTKLFDNTQKMNLFTIRESVKGVTNAAGEKFSASITIDFFYTEEIDKTNLHHLDRLEEDLNLPFGKGCSEFVSASEPSSSKQSFIMNYNHQSAQSTVSLAYDHEANYLRKEVLGKSLMVWDLNEDLLYHVDQQVNDAKLTNTVDVQVPFEICSVISIDDSGKDDGRSSRGSKLVPPYKQRGSSIDVIEFLGAKKIAYLGQTTVRDLPCQVFETILDEPPRIFDIDLRLEQARKSDFDFIVQYHIFKTNANDGKVIKYLERIPLAGDQFWPARISLTRRHKATGFAELLDQLEIKDFHWGLYGWTKKPSELFMIPECFNDQDEQLRINLAINLDSAHSSADSLKALRHNKYKMEQALLDSVFRRLEISRLHLSEFQLELRPNDVLANLVISDRHEQTKLTYFGPGDLPTPNSYLNNRILLHYAADGEASESACLLLAAHVSQISMVIYCPRRGLSQEPTCTAIFGEPQPAIKQPTETAPSSVSPGDPFTEDTSWCQVYRYEAGKAPKGATHDVEKIKKALLKHSFNFNTQASPQMSLQCSVHDFDVSRDVQLITISNYKYALATDSGASDGVSSKQASVRKFDTLAYNTLGDCTKMCNLDAACKSYSFCYDNSVKSDRCVLASLDLRQNEVEKQLVYAKSSQENGIIVQDKEGTKIGYTLELKTGCNIYEKNFLSAFTETDEVVRIEPETAQAFLTLPTAAECARWVEWLESQQDNFKSSIFAYCAATNTCLADEALFMSIGGATRDDDHEQASPTDTHELSCQVYRKRYQTYFQISNKVIKLKTQEAESPAQSWLKQTELHLSTVEECARACWDSFGHNCLSFDFCSPASCTLNLLDGTKPAPSGPLGEQLDYETRAGCLHYERDLKWDQLRRNHLIGHHNPLGLGGPGEGGQAASKSGGGGGGGGGGFIGNAFLFLVTGVLFLVGLAVGRIFNDRLESATMPRHSVFVDSHTSAPGPSSSSRSIQRISSTSSKFNIENEIYEDPDAIRMEDFGQKGDANADELSKSHEETSSSASQPSPSETKKSTFIDVPNLMQV